MEGVDVVQAQGDSCIQDLGLAIYFLYGAKHSRLATDPNYSLEADEIAHDEREVVGV